MAPTLTELIARATWREAVTYRETWPHEYVLSERDGQQELLAAVCERFRSGEGVACRFFSMDNTYLFIGDLPGHGQIRGLSGQPRELRLNPNPPMDTDGQREDNGRGVREYRRDNPGSNLGRREVGGRSAGAFGGADGGLQWLWRARWRDRTRQEALADWAGASLRGRWVGWRVSGGRAPSGWEWNGSQLAVGPGRG